MSRGALMSSRMRPQSMQLTTVITAAITTAMRVALLT